MSIKGKQKGFGVTKKAACDQHHCKKHKKAVSNLIPVKSGIKHSRVHKSIA